jgi:predicted alpha-1,2-mannosidase
VNRVGALLLVLAGCASDAAKTPEPAKPFDPTTLVDPFIGTGGHGHTFPGATVPFGMVQLSPDTRLDGWDGCSGYHYDDEWIYGFSHTHLSGTGCSDYGDVLLMPGVGEVQWNNGADGTPGYRQRFSHANETASPGYYSVVLDSGVKAELTATTRCGVHRYTFPPGAEPHVLVDLAHRDEVLESDITWDGHGFELQGLRRSRAWARNQSVYFKIRFSRRASSIRLAAGGHETSSLHASGKDVKACVGFAPSDEPLVVEVGLSAVDRSGPALNLDAECPKGGPNVSVPDFDDFREAAREDWRKQLGKIEIQGGTDAQRRTFYTALYHCCIAPNVFGDVDGRYRGRDGKVHEAKGWTQYTVFSLWDTFRALHPLMTILEPQRTNDWINTFLAQHREGGALPVWELAGNETDCMIGYHAVPVIADAYAKGIRGFNATDAVEAMIKSATRDVRGLTPYRKQGFVPADEEGESVSKTLEYAYDDWCIAQLARPMMRSSSYAEFMERSQSWKNLFDPATGFFRPRRNNAWIEPFDPAEVNNHLTEANSWQYSLFVPHDIDGLTAMLGGPEKLAERLDALFTAPSATKGRDQADISGMIGQYAHGNEPSHHMAYLYDYAGQPWKTQERVRQIMDTLYSDKPDGLCGNEDCGQMSAWYVFSALGFYPVCPGRPEYALGAPLFPEAVLHLDGGKTFTVRAVGEGPYVQDARWRDLAMRGRALTHEQIADGADLTFTMGPKPSRYGVEEPPRSSGGGRATIPVPYVAKGDRVFERSTDVALGVADHDEGWTETSTGRRVLHDTRIRFSLDGGATFRDYEAPIRLDATTDVVVEGYRPVLTAPDFGGATASRRATARFLKTPHAWTLRLAHAYAPQYAANGDKSLVDGLRGGGDWRTGDWQGFQGVDVDATVDLGEARDVGKVRVGFVRDVGSWVWLPTEVRLSVSDDGATFRDAGALTTKEGEREEGTKVLYYEFAPKTRARFVRIVGVNRGTCPVWHPGAGRKAWLFADEIEVE